MARPLTASKSSHRGWCERILLSCDCAVHCAKEVMSVKLLWAFCKRPRFYSLMSVTLMQWRGTLQVFWHCDNCLLSRDFIVFAPFFYLRSLFSLKKTINKQTIASLAKVFIVLWWHLFFNVKHCSLFQKVRPKFWSLDNLKPNSPIALRLWCWKQSL